MCLAGHACATCCRNCFLMHKAKYVDSSMVSSFFKIMFGKKIDQLLVVPPAFSKKLKSLVGKKITLEDSSRRKWDVLLSNVNGCLAFRKGWDNFTVDHDIVLGDLLVFYHFGNSHFLVEIYARSGCPKKFLSGSTTKNRISDSYETTRCIPRKRPSESLDEQPPQKRYYTSHAFPGTNIDVTPRPMHVHAMNEPSLMARNVLNRGHIRKSSPRVVHVADPLEEPRSMTRQDKSRRKVGCDPDTLVDPCSMTSRDKNKPKVVPGGGPKDCYSDSDETTSRSCIPRKRPSEPLCEQSPQKRHYTSHAFPGPNTDDTPRPKNVHAVKEPSIMTRNGLNRGHVHKSPPTVFPVSDPLEEPCSMTSRDKSRPKEVRSRETLVNPCSFTSRDKNRPKVVPVAETLVEPCFMTTRDDNFSVEGDRDRLFDLSAFEMPGKKWTIDKEEETDCPLDLSIDDLPEKGSDANRAGKPHVTGMGGKKTSIDRDYLPDMPIFEMPENECTNVNCKGQLHGNPHCQESENYQNAETEDALIDLPNCQMSERNTEAVLSESREAESLRQEFTPLTSSLPEADLHIESIVPLEIIGTPKTSEFSDLSGGKMRLNDQETRECNQESCGNVEGKSSIGAGFSISEHNSRDLGGKLRRIPQEPRECKQDICGDVMVDCSSGGIFSSCGNLSENFNPTAKIEANVNAIVKFEPVDCDAPSATAAKVTCPIPPDYEDFLELPEPLSVAVSVNRRHIKYQHQLVLLRDPYGRLWPVVYHHKNGFNVLTSGWKTFMMANNIQPGNECIFTVENSEESTFTVQVVDHD